MSSFVTYDFTVLLGLNEIGYWSEIGWCLHWQFHSSTTVCSNKNLCDCEYHMPEPNRLFSHTVLCRTVLYVLNCWCETIFFRCLRIPIGMTNEQPIFWSLLLKVTVVKQVRNPPVLCMYTRLPKCVKGLGRVSIVCQFCKPNFSGWESVTEFMLGFPLALVLVGMRSPKLVRPPSILLESLPR